MSDVRTRQARSVLDELRELRDIARREHGAQARSTRHIEACLAFEERKGNEGQREPAPPQGRPKGRP